MFNSRFLALWALLPALAACSSLPVPTAVKGAAQPVFQARTSDTALWTGQVATGTRNAASFSLAITDVRGASRSPSGTLHLRYDDQSGYFAGKSTLMAYVKLRTTDGDRAIESIAMSLNHKDEGAAHFSADVPVGLPKPTSEVTGLELAFYAADRYGNLKWDSDDSRNYRFKRAL
jgi:hypothetical protein